MVEIPLAYDSAALRVLQRGTLNRINTGHAGFFGCKNGNWYYVEIGVFKQP